MKSKLLLSMTIIVLVSFFAYSPAYASSMEKCMIDYLDFPTQMPYHKLTPYEIKIRNAGDVEGLLCVIVNVLEWPIGAYVRFVSYATDLVVDLPLGIHYGEPGFGYLWLGPGQTFDIDQPSYGLHPQVEFSKLGTYKIAVRAKHWIKGTTDPPVYWTDDERILTINVAGPPPDHSTAYVWLQKSGEDWHTQSWTSDAGNVSVIITKPNGSTYTPWSQTGTIAPEPPWGSSITITANPNPGWKLDYVVRSSDDSIGPRMGQEPRALYTNPATFNNLEETESFVVYFVSEVPPPSPPLSWELILIPSGIAIVFVAVYASRRRKTK